MLCHIRPAIWGGKVCNLISFNTFCGEDANQIRSLTAFHFQSNNGELFNTARHRIVSATMINMDTKIDNTELAENRNNTPIPIMITTAAKPP